MADDANDLGMAAIGGPEIRGHTGQCSFFPNGIVNGILISRVSNGTVVLAAAGLLFKVVQF